ncbi:MAG TPA: hypothetical protein ENI87_01610, partial [bacterium]|nr:hypothetical protein [bacterium]
MVLQTSTPPGVTGADPVSGRLSGFGRMHIEPPADNPETMSRRVIKEQSMQHSEPRKEAGFTFAELAFAMLILVVGATVLINHLSVNFKTTATERDRVFAFSKAQAILSEIQSLVDRGGVEAAVDLDEYDDGVVNKYPLTIQTEGGLLVSPAHVLSGNYQRDGTWVWSRRISVQPFTGIDNRNVRYVTVRIFKRDTAGVEHQMAELSAVINSAGGSFPTTQVFDIYLLAVENIPGWWVFMESMKPFVESMITDLENRNPGLSFRTHWITKAAYGRNQGYRPFINEAVDSVAPITEVYHYPGRMPNGNASTYYYVPDVIKGRINLDGQDWNGYDATLNPYPYALADFFNHAMRYPDEYALWQTKVAAIEQREQAIRDAIANGTPAPPEFSDMSKEPTLRILLDEMATDPDRYRHAMVINLHGELLPMPALRNYSDAAKAPEVPGQEHWRVVTHPEELRTKLNDGGVTDNLKLRMYAYVDNRTYYTGSDRMSQPMVVELVGIDLIDHSDSDEDRLHANAQLDYVYGGVPVAGSSDYPNKWLPAVHKDDVGDPNEEMYYTAEFVQNPGADPFTRIYLFNTPLICPLDSNNRGLAATRRARLYDMEYVPCPIDKDSGSGEPIFEPDLTDIGATGTKNTARWTLTLDKDVLTSNQFVDTSGSGYNPTGDVQLQIRTRIASGYTSGDTDWQTSGQVFPTLNQPDNLST